MKSFLKQWILVACCLLLLPVIAFAQDANPPQVVDLQNGYSISLPFAWTLLRGGGVVTARGSGMSLKIFTPTYIDTLNTNISAATNVVDALITLYALPPTSTEVPKADVLKSRAGNDTVAVYADVSDDSTDQMAFVIAMPSGSPGYLLFSADKGDLVGLQDIVAPIVASFTQTETPGADTTPVHRGASIGGAAASSNGDAAPGDSATGGASDVNCTVSTDTANSAQLRVGPGTNRGAISFLPVNVEVTVTGRIVLNDKSVWYQLDKSEAAPKGTSAAELWVTADQVTPTGDCDHVGETSAPPVIPGNVAPPPATNNSGDQGSADQGSASSAPGALPATGSWTMSVNATTNASCQGYQNVPAATTEILDTLTYHDVVRIVSNGTFDYSGDRFTRIPNTNSFEGSFTLDDGSNSQMRFNLSSPTTMSGQLVVNFTLDNTPCSATILFVTNHN